MAELIIRKKSSNTWEHTKGGETVILSDGFFRIINNRFELTEPSGIDQFRGVEKLTTINEISLYDDTGSGTLEQFAKASNLTDRLKELEYPFFKTALGGSGANGSARPTTTIKSKDTFFTKHPDNNNPANNEIFEPFDFAENLRWSNTEIWLFPQWLGGDKDVEENWNVGFRRNIEPIL